MAKKDRNLLTKEEKDNNLLENLIGVLLIVSCFIEARLLFELLIIFESRSSFDIPIISNLFSNIHTEIPLTLFIPILNIIVGMMIINKVYKNNKEIKNSKLKYVLYILITIIIGSIFIPLIFRNLKQFYSKTIYNSILLLLFIIYRIFAIKYYKKIVGPKKSKKMTWIAIIVFLLSFITLFVITPKHYEMIW